MASSAEERESVGKAGFAAFAVLVKEGWKHLESKRPSQQVEHTRARALLIIPLQK